MALAHDGNIMKKRFTYRELTLVAGVVVALIVAFTLWFRQPLNALPGKPKVTGTTGFSSLRKESMKKYFIAFEELLSDLNNPY
jgi:hypothetical protein